MRTARIARLPPWVCAPRANPRFFKTHDHTPRRAVRTGMCIYHIAATAGSQVNAHGVDPEKVRQIAVLVVGPFRSNYQRRLAWCRNVQ